MKFLSKYKYLFLTTLFFVALVASPSKAVAENCIYTWASCVGGFSGCDPPVQTTWSGQPYCQHIGCTCNDWFQTGYYEFSGGTCTDDQGAQPAAKFTSGYCDNGSNGSGDPANGGGGGPNPPTFDLTVTPSAITVNKGLPYKFDLSLVTAGNFNGSVRINALGGPSTAAFNSLASQIAYAGGYRSDCPPPYNNAGDTYYACFYFNGTQNTTATFNYGENPSQTLGGFGIQFEAANASNSAQRDVENVTLHVNNPIDGVCGTANKTYPSTASGYGSDTFCTAGIVTDPVTHNSPFTPAFPTAGNTVSWDCEGANTGTTALCSASKSSASVPTVTLNATATSGASPLDTRLIWNTNNSPTSCTATSGSAGWAGSKAFAASNFQDFTGLVAGTYTYSITCANAAGTSAPATAQVVVNNPPSSVAMSVTPDGSFTNVGVNQNFTYTYTDNVGAADIDRANALLHTSLNTLNNCQFEWRRGSGLYMWRSDGSGLYWGPSTFPNGTTLGDGGANDGISPQCTITPISRTESGNNMTMVIRYQFKAPFAGPNGLKNHYMQARKLNGTWTPGLAGGWQDKGDWTVNDFPTAPVLTELDGPTYYLNTPYRFKVNATEPDNNQIRYGMDWDPASAVPDEWSGYVNSGTDYTFTHTWNSIGSKPIRALAQDTPSAANSPWTSRSINIIAPTNATADINANGNDPENINSGDTADITWTSSNAALNGCTVYTGGTALWNANSGASGAHIESPTITKTYDIDCLPSPLGAGNSIIYEDSVTVNVTIPADPRLTVIKSGKGTVDSNPVGINCGAGCQSQYANFTYNSDVILTARPASGRIFTGWSGPCTDTSVDDPRGDNTCTVHMNGAKSIIANFAVDTNLQEF